MPTVMIVEWPNGLLPGSAEWRSIAAEVNSQAPDFLVTNEMPFGPWVPASATFNKGDASDWVEVHERGLEALAELRVGCVLSTRPVRLDDKLANEGFALADGRYVACHRKQYFPEEPGWQEETWFRSAADGFRVTDVGGIRVAFLICTDLMFNERARAAGRAGADLIAVPRATGRQVQAWDVACRMAAITSGAFVASSNRRSLINSDEPYFGGAGLAVAPGGQLLAITTDSSRSKTFDLDVNRSASAKLEYPCYVREPA